MVNLKSLFAILAVVSLLLTLVGLARFGVDLWSYFNASAGAANPSDNHLNYRGLGGALGGVVAFVFFVLLYRWRKH
jgi:uncharacterized BrkB/YihY/UPF0761 family membrane protein